jgi:hypothetical protein
MSDQSGVESDKHAGAETMAESAGCLVWAALGVVELVALFATWGTAHFWIALLFPPCGLWVTFAWLLGLPPFPLE